MMFSSALGFGHVPVLGRVLDQLYRKGLNEVFVSVVLEAVKTYQLELDTVHLDCSSFLEAIIQKELK